MDDAIAKALTLIGDADFILGAAFVWTFILEDLAVVASGLLVEAGRAPMAPMLVVLMTGVLLGDLGLYGLGALGARYPRIARWIGEDRVEKGRAFLTRRTIVAVVVSRSTPGARLPTYLAAGYLGVSFSRFCLAAVPASIFWTFVLFYAAYGLGAAASDVIGDAKWVLAGLVVAALLWIFRRRIVAPFRPAAPPAGE